MISRRAAMTTLSIATVVLLGWVHAGDKVRLTNEPGGQENGVIVWGDGAPRSSFGSSDVDVGAVTGGIANQAVSFTIGRPPVLRTGVPWTNGDETIDLEYPAPFTVPIKFWILCASKNCKDPITDAQKDELAFFLASANELLLAERAGFALEKSGGDAWISDETQNMLDGVKSYLKFNKDDCDEFLEAVSALRTPGAFNVYVVKTVKFDKDAGTSSRGYACEGCHDTSIVGYQARWDTILHELGHNLSLWHTDEKSWYQDVGGEENLMAQISTGRRFLTEGQVFRMLFDKNSGLNSPLEPNPRPASPPARDCHYSPSLSEPCPGEHKSPWPLP